MMKKVVYAVVYDDITLITEWYYSLAEAIYSASLFGGRVYKALIPSRSWNFYDIGEKLNMIAKIESPFKWRIKNA